MCCNKMSYTIDVGPLTYTPCRVFLADQSIRLGSSPRLEASIRPQVGFVFSNCRRRSPGNAKAARPARSNLRDQICAIKPARSKKEVGSFFRLLFVVTRARTVRLRIRRRRNDVLLHRPVAEVHLPATITAKRRLRVAQIHGFTTDRTLHCELPRTNYRTGIWFGITGEILIRLAAIACPGAAFSTTSGSVGASSVPIRS